MPFWTPCEVPLDEGIMKLMFEAFDTNHSGGLNKEEVEGILIAAKMEDKSKRAKVLSMVSSMCFLKHKKKLKHCHSGRCFEVYTRITACNGKCFGCGSGEMDLQ